MAHDVFISYSSEDKLFADALCAALERERIRCWIAPRDVKAGANWSAAIMEAISGGKILVLVFSAHANASHHVRREVQYACSRELTIIPFRVERFSPTGGMEFFLDELHWLDALTPPVERHHALLVKRIKELLAYATRSTDSISTTSDAPGQSEAEQRPRGPAPGSRGKLARPNSRMVALATLVVAMVSTWLYFGKFGGFRPPPKMPPSASTSSSTPSTESKPIPTAPSSAGSDRSGTPIPLAFTLPEQLDFNLPKDATLEDCRVYARSAVMSARWSDAAHAYTQLLARDPTSLEAYDQRAEAYSYLGRNVDANTDYNHATLLQPSDPLTEYFLGDAFAMLKRTSEAKPHFEAAALNDAWDAYERCIRGMAYSWLDDYTHAAKDFNGAIALNPQSAFARYNLGRVYFWQKNFPDAVDALSHSIKFNQQFVRGYLLRADALKALGRTQEAEDDENTVAKLNKP